MNRTSKKQGRRCQVIVESHQLLLRGPVLAAALERAAQGEVSEDQQGVISAGFMKLDGMVPHKLSHVYDIFLPICAIVIGNINDEFQFYDRCVAVLQVKAAGTQLDDISTEIDMVPMAPDDYVHCAMICLSST